MIIIGNSKYLIFKTAYISGFIFISTNQSIRNNKFEYKNIP